MPDMRSSLFYAHGAHTGPDQSGDDGNMPSLHVAGRRFRRFGRVAADGRVLTYTGLDRSCLDDDRYLDHEIDKNAYGRPLPITGQATGWDR